MCGIATISIGRKCRGRIPYPVLRQLVQKVMENLEDRGADASGIAVINQEAGQSRVYKMPLRASRLVVRPKFQSTLECIGEGTNFIMLHARQVTTSSNADNVDNHPIVADHIVGIHNGTILNDEALEKKWELPRRGKVDSEVIFRLFQKFLDQGDGPEVAMKRTTALLEGYFTGAAVDMRYPHRMTMFKHDRPLHALYLPYYDLLIASTFWSFYDRAKIDLKIKVTDRMFTIEENTGVVVDLSREDGVEKPPSFELGSERCPWLSKQLSKHGIAAFASY